jgi:hypothetical protein
MILRQAGFDPIWAGMMVFRQPADCLHEPPRLFDLRPLGDGAEGIRITMVDIIKGVLPSSHRRAVA